MEKKTPREVLADNLTRLMKKRELSQHGVARLTGLSQVAVGRIAHANVGSSVDVLEPLGRGLGYAPWMLLYPDLDTEGEPLVARAKHKYSFSSGTMDRLLRLFDSLTAEQQKLELENLESLVDTNKDLVRELTQRSGFARVVKLTDRKKK